MRRATAHSDGGGGRLFPIKLITVTLLAVAGWLVINVGAIREFLDVYAQRNREQEQVDMLKQRLRILAKQQRGLNYYGFEAERQARERLQLKKPGEKVIYLKPGTSAGMAKSPQAGTSAGASPTSAILGILPNLEEQPRAEAPASD